MQQPTRHLTSFVGHFVWLKGILSVALTLTDQATQAKNTQPIAFTIVKSTSYCNLIILRSAMRKFGAIVSTIHGIVQFQTKSGFGMIYNKSPVESTAMVESEAREKELNTPQANNRLE